MAREGEGRVEDLRRLGRPARAARRGLVGGVVRVRAVGSDDDRRRRSLAGLETAGHGKVKAVRKGAPP